MQLPAPRGLCLWGDLSGAGELRGLGFAQLLQLEKVGWRVEIGVTLASAAGRQCPCGAGLVSHLMVNGRRSWALIPVLERPRTTTSSLARFLMLFAVKLCVKMKDKYFATPVDAGKLQELGEGQESLRGCAVGPHNSALLAQPL